MDGTHPCCITSWYETHACNRSPRIYPWGASHTTRPKPSWRIWKPCASSSGSSAGRSSAAPGGQRWASPTPSSGPSACRRSSFSALPRPAALRSTGSTATLRPCSPKNGAASKPEPPAPATTTSSPPMIACSTIPMRRCASKPPATGIHGRTRLCQSIRNSNRRPNASTQLSSWRGRASSRAFSGMRRGWTRARLSKTPAGSPAFRVF